MEFHAFANYLKIGHFVKFSPYKLEHSKEGWKFGRETGHRMPFLLNMAGFILNFICLVIFAFQIYGHSGQPALVALDTAFIVLVIQFLYTQWMMFGDKDGNIQICNEYLRYISRASKYT